MRCRTGAAPPFAGSEQIAENSRMPSPPKPHSAACAFRTRLISEATTNGPARYGMRATASGRFNTAVATSTHTHITAEAPITPNASGKLVFVSFLLVRAKESVTLVEEMMPPSISRDRIAAPRANGSPCKVSGKTQSGAKQHREPKLPRPQPSERTIRPRRKYRQDHNSHHRKAGTLAGGVARPLALQPNRSAIKCRNHDSESVCES